jgi:hypothetical protein
MTSAVIKTLNGHQCRHTAHILRAMCPLIFIRVSDYPEMMEMMDAASSNSRCDDDAMKAQ